MNLQLLANIADILAAIGVIISLLIVAMELRKNTAQSQVSNTYALFTMMSEYKRRTDSPHVADLIVRGRSDFQTLSEPDKIAFGYWMEEMIYAAYCAYRSEGAIGLAEGGTTSFRVSRYVLLSKHPAAHSIIRFQNPDFIPLFF